jgi:hypothetical protein
MPLRQIKGIGTIVWGTGGIAGGANGVPAGALIESITITPKNGEPIEIEDNDGLAAIQVILRDGFDAKVNVMYDGAKVWPQAGGNAALAISFNGANANAIPFGEGNGATYANGVVTYTCGVVADPQLNYAKKKEGLMEFPLRYRPNVAF